MNSLLGLTCYPDGSAHRFTMFLEEELTVMLEEILLSVRRNMWFQHDRAAAHFARQV